MVVLLVDQDNVDGTGRERFCRLQTGESGTHDDDAVPGRPFGRKQKSVGSVGRSIRRSVNG
jgi:hypothetical protein